MGYDRTIRVHADFTRTVAAARQALAAQGFGVLTEIDMAATLKTKIGRDMEDYLVLGACNPQLAGKALDADPAIGLLLPCNVVVRAEGAQTVVQALDPTTMVTLTGLEAMAPIADEATRRMDSMLAQLSEELEG
ncbi:DUF302 domain-containing protein [Streptomyces sp. NBC_00523]|uniref:DUF302 domain-containing protein n=1 Tax=unclassified Streptomyces TaxID=2593676 RepID=UPI002E806D45|nr:DUF302 domain-containing protein [Streptomyces sp. NBC_00523]WUC98342.1 DUF302 domain-containing protein [Streptomyces sp. NBC_00523]